MDKQQISNREASFLISLGLSKPPAAITEKELTSNGSEQKVEKKKLDDRELSMRKPDIKWRKIRQYIKNYFLNKGYKSSNYRELYQEAEKDGVDLFCWPKKKATLRSFSNHAMRVRVELGLPPIIRLGMKEKIIGLFDSGHSEAAISEFLKCSKPHVYNTLLKAGKIKQRPKKVF